MYEEAGSTPCSTPVRQLIEATRNHAENSGQLQAHFAHTFLEDNDERRRDRTDSRYREAYKRFHVPGDATPTTALDVIVQGNEAAMVTRIKNIVANETNRADSPVPAPVRIWVKCNEELGIDIPSTHPFRIAALDGVLDKLPRPTSSNKPPTLILAVALCPTSDDIIIYWIIQWILTQILISLTATVANLFTLLQALGIDLAHGGVWMEDINPLPCDCIPHNHCSAPRCEAAKVR
jgi:hypothetical protein